MSTKDNRLAFTIEIAQEAGQIARTMRAQKGSAFISSKGHQDFVTEADRAVEAFLRQKIAEAYPDEAFIGEEDGITGTGSRTWVVDPIDGTANYMRSLPEWGVSIAFVDGDQITHGVIDLPDTQETAAAHLGGGAFLNGTKMSVSDVEAAKSAVAILGYSSRQPLKNHFQTIEHLLNEGFEYRRQGSACFGLFSVATGRAEAYAEHHINAWDAFAGMLLVSEAGGDNKSDEVQRFMKDGSFVLASNGRTTIQSQLEAATGL